MAALLAHDDVDISQPCSGGQTLLHHVAKSDMDEAVSVLVDRGMDIDRRDGLGKTPLHHAVVKGSGAVAKIILERGANPDIKDRWGRIPLHYAIFNNDKSTLKLLVRAVNANRQNHEGETAIHYAVRYRKTTLAEALLERNDIDLDLKDCRGNTALSMARKRGFDDMVELLESHPQKPKVQLLID